MHRSGRFELQFDRRRLLQCGEPVALGSRAYDLLVALWERRARVVGKAELLDLVWPGLVVEENNLQVQIGHLRKVLGADAIATVPGRGYRLTRALEAASTGPAFAAAAGFGEAAHEPLSPRLARAPARDLDLAGAMDSRSLSEAVAACRRLVLIDMLTAGRAEPGGDAGEARPPIDLGDARKVLEAARAALEVRIVAAAAATRPSRLSGLATGRIDSTRDGADPQPPWE